MSSAFETLRIRPWRASDIGPIAAIERQAYPFPWPEGVLLDCFEAGHHGWVAGERGGRVAAYAIVQPIIDEAHLLNICTAPDWQGQGVGRGMLRWVMSACRELGMQRMLLEVRASNLPALHLYRSEGFTEDGVRKGYYPASGGREDAILMSRFLNA
ncbi:ribosomal protein S18-alanine N-acetyltransferase [Thiofaba sp. EF100]|uniref:ribosomal protein S18-alanine N-acetyltransferase n=1 Tax=Thiofaba sp. EF100 TaxID=3121274 RepID=UPI0032214E43